MLPIANATATMPAETSVTARARVAIRWSTPLDKQPRVTVISDSVLTQVLWHPYNLAILDQGVDLGMEVAICRRLAGTSCAVDGVPPPTLFDLLPTLSNLGTTVVVEMGYNDDPASFRANVEEAIARLTARGVTHIVWPTLRVSKSEFAAMNQVLSRSAASARCNPADLSGSSSPDCERFASRSRVPAMVGYAEDQPELAGTPRRADDGSV